MEKCILRHKDGHDHNEIFRQLSCILIGLIKPWEKRRNHKHHNRNSRTAHNGKCDHLIIRIPCFLHISSPQKLSHHNGNRISKSNKHHVKYIVNGIGNILSSYYIQSAYRITLCQDCHASRPQGLVQKKRGTFYQNFLRQAGWYLQSAVQPLCKWHSVCMGMRPDNDNGYLHITGYNGSNCCPSYSQLRETKFTINKKIVKYQVHKDSCDACFHRRYSFSALTKGAGIYLTDHKWRNKHNPEILHTISAGSF